MGCSGRGKEIKLCNKQECGSGRRGWREEECSKFDSSVHSGRRYTWEPFTHKSDPCKLTCRAKGHHFYSTLSDRVVDGTPCGGATTNPSAVCLQGVCQEVGCDDIVGSHWRRDACGVCRGDNTTCRTISGLFSEKILKLGLNQMVVIPAGSTHINITGLQYSNNWLALQYEDGTYFLNGGESKTPSGDYEAAGTIFSYKTSRECSGQCITAQGPTTKPIKVMLQTQGPNHGVLYSFNVPSDVTDTYFRSVLHASPPEMTSHKMDGTLDESGDQDPVLTGDSDEEMSDDVDDFIASEIGFKDDREDNEEEEYDDDEEDDEEDEDANLSDEDQHQFDNNDDEYEEDEIDDDVFNYLGEKEAANENTDFDDDLFNEDNDNEDDIDDDDDDDFFDHDSQTDDDVGAPEPFQYTTPQPRLLKITRKEKPKFIDPEDPSFRSLRGSDKRYEFAAAAQIESDIDQPESSSSRPLFPLHTDASVKTISSTEAALSVGKQRRYQEIVSSKESSNIKADSTEPDSDDDDDNDELDALSVNPTRKSQLPQSDSPTHSGKTSVSRSPTISHSANSRQQFRHQFKRPGYSQSFTFHRRNRQESQGGNSPPSGDGQRSSRTNLHSTNSRHIQYRPAPRQHHSRDHGAGQVDTRNHYDRIQTHSQRYNRRHRHRQALSLGESGTRDQDGSVSTYTNTQALNQPPIKVYKAFVRQPSHHTNTRRRHHGSSHHEYSRQQEEYRQELLRRRKLMEEKRAAQKAEYQRRLEEHKRKVRERQLENEKRRQQHRNRHHRRRHGHRQHKHHYRGGHDPSITVSSTGGVTVSRTTSSRQKTKDGVIYRASATLLIPPAGQQGSHVRDDRRPGNETEEFSVNTPSVTSRPNPRPVTQSRTKSPLTPAPTRHVETSTAQTAPPTVLPFVPRVASGGRRHNPPQFIPEHPNHKTRSSLTAPSSNQLPDEDDTPIVIGSQTNVVPDGDDRSLVIDPQTNVVPGVVDRDLVVGGDRSVLTNDDEGDKMSYEWRVSGLTECTMTCGGGLQQAAVVCLDTRTQAVVTNGNCAHLASPEIQTVTCNTRPCPAQWQTNQWSACSVSCGTGLQSRLVTCSVRVSATLNLTMPEDNCPTSKPDSSRQCQSAECNVWKTGNWSQCSVRCGEGVKTRDVYCTDQTGYDVSDDLCPGIKPASQEACETEPCGKGWYYTPWPEQCPVDCGSGRMVRQVRCLGDGGRVLSDASCDIRTQPSQYQACQAPVSCGGQWFTGQWAQCNVTCGHGYQKRSVLCMKSLPGGLLTVVREENCASADKPQHLEPCNMPVCPPQWYITSWSECSEPCGTGQRSREVKCLDNEDQRSSECPLAEKPRTREVCNTHDCTTRPSQVFDSECKDSFSRCEIVRHAGMCRYPYYKKKCCATCAEDT